jgi:NAD-dependent dihydropyrimidine dehydrogenase PreA subunit
MTHVIAQPCIGTKSADCVEVCPVDCIYEAADQFYIAPDECIDCGACVSVCPVDAIFPEAEVPPDQQSFVAKNAELAKSGGSKAMPDTETPKRNEEPQDGNEVARKVFAEARRPPQARPAQERPQEAPKAAASPTPGGGGTTTQKKPPTDSPGQAPAAKATPDAKGQGKTPPTRPPAISKEERESWDPQKILPIEPAKMPKDGGQPKAPPATAARTPASAARPESPDAMVAVFEAGAQALEAAAAAMRAAARRR